MSAPRRRWFRFSLRTLLLVITALALWLGYIVHAARVQRDAVAALRAFNSWVDVAYDFQIDEHHYPFPFNSDAVPKTPAWLTNFLGIDFLNSVVMVRLRGRSATNSQDDMSPRDAMQALSKLPRLKKLDLEGLAICDADLELLKGLTHLAKLSLATNSISGVGLSSLVGMHDLYELDLDSNVVTDAGLQHLPVLRSLHMLSLSNNRLVGDGLEFLSHVPNITRLDLANNRVTGESLRHLTGFPRLYSLDLTKNRITDGGMQHLIALEDLCILRLSHNQITDDGLKSLVDKGLVDQWNQMTLDFSDNRITDRSVEALATIKSLFELDLSGTDITSASLGFLGNLEGHRRLTIHRTRITVEEATQFQASHPDWYIEIMPP